MTFRALVVSYGTTIVVLVALLVTVSVVDGTFSILALDLQTQQIGGILATCLARDEIGYTIDNIVANASLVAVPCRGGIIAQGWWELSSPEPLKTVGEPLLLDSQNHLSARDILHRMTDPSVDDTAIQFSDTFSTQFYKLRQYGVVTPTSASIYSGSDLVNQVPTLLGFPNGNVQGEAAILDDTLVYSIQGNLIASNTIEEASRALLNATMSQHDDDICMDLPQMLVHAMVSADSATGGDVRCIGETFAYIRVVGPTGEVQLDIQVHLSSNFTGPNALERLESEFDAWRMQHPCGSASQPYQCPASTIVSQSPLTWSPTSVPTRTTESPTQAPSSQAHPLKVKWVWVLALASWSWQHLQPFLIENLI